jgi:hypothetical protein
MKDNYLKSTCQLKQIVKNVTHMSSVIDLFYTDLSDIYSEPLHEPGIGLSRHHTLVFTPSSYSHKVEKIYVTKRNQNARNKRLLKEAILNINWTPLYKAHSCEEKYTIFEKTIQSLVDHFLPYHTVIRKSNDLPWITDKFRSLIKKRQYFFHTKNEVMFKFYRNKVNRERKRLKQQHVVQSMSNMSENPKNWWKSIKSLIGLNKKENSLLSLAQTECQGDFAMLAEKINTNFYNVSSHLAPLKDKKYKYHNIPEKYIIPVSKVENQLKNLNTSKSPGPDQLPTWLLKEMALVLAPPICSIYNASFQDTYIPNIWKSANTCPLPKSSPPLNINKDLRPISLTPILSKNIELYARDWFMEYFKNTIDEHQYGSQKECSTVIALAQLIHNWLLCLDGPNTIIRILLIDFSKAFDLVDHNILINKVAETGVPEFLTDWLYEFLRDRRQRVKLGDTFSTWVNMKAGVPQGTLLGPVTFLLHINDLSTQCTSVKYVDDTTLWEACDPAGTSSKLQNAADQVELWCNINKMKLNTDKTKELVVNFTKNKILPDPIKLNRQELDRVQNTKLLGLILNDNLTWGDHVLYTCKKASKRLYFLRLLKRAGITSLDIVNVYCSIIRSILEYACEVWHPSITKEHSKQLEYIQKRALKIAFPCSSYEEALNKASIKPLSDRREDRCKAFFDAISKETHKLHYLLPPKCSYTSLRNNRSFQLPKIKTNRLKLSPIYYGLFRFQLQTD